MMILVFAGEYIIPEYRDDLDKTTFAGSKSINKWRDDWYVRSGRFYDATGHKDYATVFDAEKIYSRHFTFIFNAFVMMQVFNFMNARKLHEEVLLM
jgi:P-type Ca2+ transporter type 2B